MSTSGVLRKDGLIDAAKKRARSLALLDEVVGDSTIFQIQFVPSRKGGFGGGYIGDRRINRPTILSWRTRGWIELVAGRFSRCQIYRRVRCE